MRAAPLLAVLLVSVLAIPAHAQVVRGRVLDHATGEPVAAVTVEAFAGGTSGGRARSGADGSFQVRLRAPGAFRLEHRSICTRSSFGWPTCTAVECCSTRAVTLCGEDSKPRPIL